MECWLQLGGFTPSEAVLHIRLCCTPALQHSLDARFTVLQWSTLSSSAALDAIEKIVLVSSNQVVNWCNFFRSDQLPTESVSVYFLRSTQSAADCKFQCPHCDGDLLEYMLLQKLMVGLHNPVLKREVFQACNQFSDVDALCKYCVTFESAHKDATVRQGCHPGPLCG